MKLAIPIFHNGIIYREAELKKPSGSVIADTKKMADTGDFFSSLRVFLIGCIESISYEGGTVTDNIALKSLVSKMPYKTAEQVAIKVVMLVNDDDDGVEGVYNCPRCGNQVIAELKETDGMSIDTRDFISQLEIGYYEGDGIITTQLEDSVFLKNSSSGETIDQIDSYSIMFPTLEHGINAYQKYGIRDEVRLQFAMFTQALVKINGQEIDSRWRNNLGMVFFEGIKNMKADVGTLTKFINSYGVIPDVSKVCSSCGKEWKARINTSNFFVSALRL